MKNPYQGSSLNWLIRAIVDDSNRSALHELHENRRFFSHTGRSQLTLSEFLTALSEQTPLAQSSYASLAYDLALEKFLNFPNEICGTDCRNYYQAALNTLAKKAWSSELEADKRLGQILQYLVAKHFNYALKEAGRTQQEMSRYNWNTVHGTFIVMMPKTLSGSQRSEWLAQNVSVSDLKKSTAREVVQGLIDETFSGTRLDATEGMHIADTRVTMPWDTIDAFNLHDFANTVALEKVDTLSEQRRAIQQLGGTSVLALILDVFDAVESEEVSDADIAKKYNLSPATFSRFAGRKWTQIPDLWKNAAGVLSHTPEFKEALLT